MSCECWVGSRIPMAWEAGLFRTTVDYGHAEGNIDYLSAAGSLIWCTAEI